MDYSFDSLYDNLFNTEARYMVNVRRRLTQTMQWGF